MEKITASIVIYRNKAAELENTITSFLSSSTTGVLYIIDNSPTPEAGVICKKHNCEYIYTGDNLGYGRAHNLIMNKIIDKSAYHLVLNPDVYFGSDVLEKLLDFMESHPQTGLVMPRVLYPNGSIQRLCKLLPTPLNLATRRFFPAEKGWLKKLNDQYEMTFSNYNKVMNVPFLSGCFMFLRNSALKETGLFDERFFMYAEDTDLSRRIHQKFDTTYYPHVDIYHTHARGSYKNFKLTWYNIRSAIQYFNKWGWLFDEERKMINQTASEPHGQNNYEFLDLIQTRLASRPSNE